MAQPKVSIQSPERRIRNFDEVSLGFPKKLATDEAGRCPQCADPVCRKGCPLGIDIPAFIRSLREGNVAAAYSKIREKSFFPSICGRICTAPCEVACVFNDEKSPIAIRSLERFASDFGRGKISKKDIPNRGKKVAIIGSGPAGLSAAAELASLGFFVTIFEAMDRPGGVLRYGIPEFRIPQKTLDSEISQIIALGVEIKTNVFVGKTMTFEEIKKEGYEAILLTTGAGSPQFMDIPGTHWGGVYYGEEFLMRLNLIQAPRLGTYKPNFFVGGKIVVIGSGNTALDCARAARRLKRNVTLVFRRTEEEMRTRSDEREYAKEEGIHLEPLVRPMEIVSGSDHFVSGLKCVRMDYAENKETGGWELTVVPDSQFVIEADTVIIAIGHIPNSLVVKNISDVNVSVDGTISVDAHSSMTSVKGIFAAGNVVTNAGPVVEAIAAGRKVAAQIVQYLS
jgi:glutamate synthase (NADPH/NADH) small chain